METSDLEFAVWFAAAAQSGWEPFDETVRLQQEATANLVPGAQPLPQVLSTLARSASAMHDAIFTLALGDEPRADSVGVAEAVLCRAAIESLGTGLWLMLAPPEVQRMRYVSLMLRDLEDLFGAVDDDVARRSVVADHPLFDRKDLVDTRISGIIGSVDKALGTDSLTMWRVYSGMAHGRPWAHQAWRRMLGSIEPGREESAAIVLMMLVEPVDLARRFLVIADLRRRFEESSDAMKERGV